MQQERLSQLKNPMTSLEIEPATFWLVACEVWTGLVYNI
jgi:hypothetical protein